MNILTLSSVFISMLTIVSTIAVFQLFAYFQRKYNTIWIQPMLITIAIVIVILVWQNISFADYFQSSWVLNALLEPAVVALGFPLYQHLETITKQWKMIVCVLLLGVLIAVSVSFIITLLLINDYALAVSLSLKSVTTPIAIAIAKTLEGNIALTAFAIIIAGFSGALAGPRWLKWLNVTSPKAIGLAIGAASHAIGTATISNKSYEHAAYGSMSLIISAVLTALISPLLIEYLSLFLLNG